MNLKIKSYKLYIFAMLFIITGCKKKDNLDIKTVSIIPQPSHIEVLHGYFKINKQTKILINSDNERVKDVANYFLKQVNHVSGYSLSLSSYSEQKSKLNTIVFSDQNVEPNLGTEGYTLKSNSNNIYRGQYLNSYL